MKYLSTFAGIGGFDLGFERAGLECAGFSEIDRNASAVLARHFPHVTNHGDIAHVDRHTAGTVDLVCGGTPCQNLSAAGDRSGLVGKKSRLFFEFHRVLTELNPQWVVFENVANLLSSRKGQDFAIVLGGLTGVIPAVPQDGWGNAGIAVGYDHLYKVAWRVLDAQYWGVAQRRRRVFIVGHLGDGRAAQVLFERDGGEWNTPSRRTPGQDVASSVKASPPSRRDGGSSSTPGEFVVSAYGGGRQAGAIDTATTLTTKNQRLDWESETLIAYGLSGELNASEELVGALDAAGKGGGGQPAMVAVAGTLGAQMARNRGLGNANETDLIIPVHAATGEDLSPSLTTTHSTIEDGNRRQAFGVTPHGVRRLTPLECERLMGFPDGWTEGFSDSARYYMLGNSIVVPVTEWLGRRILEHA